MNVKREYRVRCSKIDANDQTSLRSTFSYLRKEKLVLRVVEIKKIRVIVLLLCAPKGIARAEVCHESVVDGGNCSVKIQAPHKSIQRNRLRMVSAQVK